MVGNFRRGDRWLNWRIFPSCCYPRPWECRWRHLVRRHHRSGRDRTCRRRNSHGHRRFKQGHGVGKTARLKPSTLTFQFDFEARVGAVSRASRQRFLAMEAKDCTGASCPSPSFKASAPQHGSAQRMRLGAPSRLGYGLLSATPGNNAHGRYLHRLRVVATCARTASPGRGNNPAASRP
jgi:hypothetical protein